MNVRSRIWFFPNTRLSHCIGFSRFDKSICKGNNNGNHPFVSQTKIENLNTYVDE